MTAYYVFDSYFTVSDREYYRMGMDALLTADPKCEEWGEYYILSDETIDNKSVAYNDTLIKKYTPMLSKGGWLKTAKLNRDVIPVVVGQATGYHMGQLIPASDIINQLDISATCKVVGVLDSRCKVPVFDQCGDDVNFTSDMLLGNSSHMVICSWNYMTSQKKIKSPLLYRANGTIVYTKAGYSFDDFQRRYGFIGYTVNLQSGYKHFVSGFKENMSVLITRFLFILCVTMFCIVVNEFTIQSAVKRKNGILHMYGMTRRQIKYWRGIQKGILIVMLLSVFLFWTNQMFGN